MQLKKTSVKSALLAASCSLLGSQASAENWEFEGAIMYYGESDRVQALEGIVQAKKALKNDREFNAKLVVDSLTGASANGAVPQQEAQTFTSPSGNGQYSASADETPLDDTFLDTRFQVAGQWSQPLGESYTFSTGANFSNEYDYQSFSFNAMFGRYLNTKNTTLSLGVSYALDTIDAVGGRPIGLSAMVVDNGQFASEQEFDNAFEATRQNGGSDSKDTVDIVFGLTQVVSRRWITQMNIGFSSVDGYLTDPYKVISLVDDDGSAVSQHYESRPDSRSKQSFYVQSKYHFDKSIWDISYRLSDDDWGIQSHTIETRYRLLFANNSYFEPHLRFYQQKEADFYQPFLREEQVLPEFASADYRIGKLDAYTVGLKYGKKLKSGREYGVRLEYYSQAPKDSGVSAPGQLQPAKLYPNVDALILQFDFKF